MAHRNPRPSRRDNPGRRSPGKARPDAHLPSLRQRPRRSSAVNAPQPKGTVAPRKPALPRIGIVISRYNASVTDHLLEGALGEFERAGGKRSDVIIVDAPGSYETIMLSLALARSRRVDGVVALGCIIKGETIHDQVIADAVAHGLAHVMIATNVPIALGVLTVDTPAQAQARAGGDKGNKGAEATSALLLTIASIRRITQPSSPGTAPRSQRPDKGEPPSSGGTA